NIILEADDKVVNSNGSKISADKYLHIKAKKLENIGKIEDFGKLKKIWKDKDGKVYDEKDIEKWITSIRGRSIKSKAILNDNLKEFQDNILDHFSSKFGEGYNKNFREFHRGIVTKIASLPYNKQKEIKTLTAGYEVVGQKVKLSELSGTDIKLEIEDNITNKDSIIKAENSNVIKTKVFNNISSVKKEEFIFQDGIEKLSYYGLNTCLDGKSCVLNNGAKYERKLNESNKIDNVDLYLPNSELIGKEITLETKESNFKGHGQDKIVEGKLSNLYLRTDKLNVDNFGLHHTNISIESDDIRLKNGGLIADNQLNIKTKKLESIGDVSVSKIENITRKQGEFKSQKLLSENYLKSKLVGQNVLIKADEVTLKATDIIANGNILLDSKKLNIKEDIKTVVDITKEKINKIEAKAEVYETPKQRKEAEKKAKAEAEARAKAKVDGKEEEEPIIKVEKTRERKASLKLAYKYKDLDKKLVDNQVVSSVILGKNIQLSGDDIHIKGSNILADEKASIIGKNVYIDEARNKMNETKVSNELELGIKAEAGTKRGVNVGINLEYDNTKSDTAFDYSNKSNIIAKNIEIKALEDISSSADMKAKENILIKGNNIYLKDT
ncbi:hemagglutinin repeat-containing protein, partial [Oceanivirga salmonicida]|uniref:hemagglutinin repeat-containing protein n=1 Tax=Oceanivirga salmonicida TaxID=1769291 RepID=UPI0018CC6EA7